MSQSRRVRLGAMGRRQSVAKSERGRPAGRAALSQELIVEVAQSLVDQFGIEALTMRKIADTLDITPMALYRYVRNKNDLLVQMLDHSVAGLAPPELPADPVSRVVALVVWMHDGLSRHQWVIQVLTEGDLIAPSILWALDEIYGSLSRSGLDLPAAADVFRLIWRFVIGDLIERAGRAAAAKNAPSRPPQQETVPVRADPEQYPHVAALEAYWRSRRSRDDFAADLDRLTRALLSGR
jgi:AcrR family transcriptional regulator